MFLFLALMWVVIKIFSGIFRNHALLEEKNQKNRDQTRAIQTRAIPKQSSSPILPVAAILAAVHFFRRNIKN